MLNLTREIKITHDILVLTLYLGGIAVAINILISYIVATFKTKDK
jgi:hypothetical protein